jgi:hypothetical protein
MAGASTGQYLLVDLNADGALGDVPDATGATVVELVGHALVDGAIHLDVDVLADLVGVEVGGEQDVPLLAEAVGASFVKEEQIPEMSRSGGGLVGEEREW